jgi:hypothetical protein
MLERRKSMGELFLKHNSMTYLFDTNLLKLYRLEESQPIEINNPEIVRNVRLYSSEISREQALKMTDGNFVWKIIIVN